VGSLVPRLVFSARTATNAPPTLSNPARVRELLILPNEADDGLAKLLLIIK
jgi:hypothetical protein